VPYMDMGLYFFSENVVKCTEIISDFNFSVLLSSKSIAAIALFY
jgi:hypothetical protein